MLQLPPPLSNCASFSLSEISRYDERGPAWYWNDIHTSEHTGTQFDAPVHWVTGRDGEDVAQVPPASLVAPAAFLNGRSAWGSPPRSAPRWRGRTGSRWLRSATAGR